MGVPKLTSLVYYNRGGARSSHHISPQTRREPRNLIFPLETMFEPWCRKKDSVFVGVFAGFHTPTSTQCCML